MINITCKLVELGLLDGKICACIVTGNTQVEITGLSMEQCTELKDFFGENITIEIRGNAK